VLFGPSIDFEALKKPLLEGRLVNSASIRLSKRLIKNSKFDSNTTGPAKDELDIGFVVFDGGLPKPYKATSLLDYASYTKIVTAQFLNKKTPFSFWVAGYGLTNVRLPNGSLLDDQPVKFLHKKTVSAMLSNPCEPQEPFGLNDSNFNCYKRNLIRVSESSSLGDSGGPLFIVFENQLYLLGIDSHQGRNRTSLYTRFIRNTPLKDPL
jgi:hypothetical protein